MKKLLATMIVGFSFWFYNPFTAGLFVEGNFQNFPDCMAVRSWMASQPAGTNNIVVSPSCYYQN